MIPNKLLSLIGFLLISLLVNAQDDEALYKKGRDLYFQGELKESLLYLDSAISLNADDLSRFLFRSKIKAKMGDFTSAVEDLTVCIDQSNNDVLYLNLRADYNEQLRKDELALEDYNESIRLKESWFTYYRRGMVYVRKEQNKKAMEDFNKAIELNEYQVGPIKARALLKFKMGDKEEACSDMYQVFDMGYEEVREWIIKNCGL